MNWRDDRDGTSLEDPDQHQHNQSARHRHQPRVPCCREPVSLDPIALLGQVFNGLARGFLFHDQLFKQFMTADRRFLHVSLQFFAPRPF